MPTFRQRQLGRELRRLREDAQLKAEDVAAQLVWSRPKLNRIENARTGITPDDLDALLEVYGVPSPDREVLFALAEKARKRGWWARFDGIFDGTFIGSEDEARTIYSWQPQLVPGLLQTEAYARAVISAGETDPARVEDRVRARLARQLLLSRPDGPLLHVVLAEAVLRQAVGGPGVLREQIVELWERSQRSNVIVQVIPFSAGAHVGLGGQFVRFEFPDPADPDLIYVEGQAGDIYVESADAHARLTVTWERITSAALSPEESEQLLLDLSRE